MPFIAECSFCGHQVRAPDNTAGLSVPCPRCGNNFTLAARLLGPQKPPVGFKLKKKKKPDAPLSVMPGPPTPKVLSASGQVPEDNPAAREEYEKPALQV